MVIHLMPGLFGYLKIPFASSHSSLCSLKFHRSFMFIEFTKKWAEICLARKPQEMSPEDFAAATHALAERGQEVPTNVIRRQNDISLFYWPHLTYHTRVLWQGPFQRPTAPRCLVAARTLLCLQAMVRTQTPVTCRWRGGSWPVFFTGAEFGV